MFTLQQLLLLVQVVVAKRFLINLLCNEMLSPKPDRVILVFGEDQAGYRKLEQKFPHMEEVKRPMPKALYDKLNSAENNLIILDGQMLDA